MEISQDLYSQSWRAGYDAADLYTNAEAAYSAVMDAMMTMRKIDPTLPSTVDRDAFMDGWIARKDDIGYEQMQRKGEPDPEFEQLLAEELVAEELKEVNSEISRHHKDFESISALCTLWRNGTMDAEQVLGFIQNIVG